ncbi:MAG: acyl-ACP--UDP-N-acetylglucosamine O-acyltransferase [Burkholderiaceae bacterium]|nr:acyl-ACP--UDP-N-acetylglucosamine O-acyltransferase [Sulfuritalea sp.]MCF8174616.1 acyl-ACP--UDP-N-acetylglucosamine O-acyltransferase [Burkholderiaceae bacterium]MCF8184141.1 acyl-ACP--UDP-N-acetylglucosamine O-acyltransferase [Polynucleobacter sp.]
MNVHPSATVAADARLGNNIRIGPYVVIEEDVILGDDCEIAAHAVIKHHTRMGARNRIAEHAVIGGDPQDFKFKSDCLSSTEIGDDNWLREGVTVHRGSRPGSATRIGNNCFLMAYSHIAHDCVVGNHVVMANTAGIAGEVVVHDYAFISAAVTVHQFCRIGRNAMIGLSSKVVQDALPFCITDGNPGRARALNLVGLRRNGFARADIGALKDAYRLLYQRVPLADAIARMRAMDRTAVTELADFIEGSTRGFAHPTR